MKAFATEDQVIFPVACEILETAFENSGACLQLFPGNHIKAWRRANTINRIALIEEVPGVAAGSTAHIQNRSRPLRNHRSHAMAHVSRSRAGIIGCAG